MFVLRRALYSDRLSRAPSCPLFTLHSFVTGLIGVNDARETTSGSMTATTTTIT